MKTTLLLGLAAAFFTSFARAEQSLGFPSKNPVMSLAAPDGRRVRVTGGELLFRCRRDLLAQAE